MANGAGLFLTAALAGFNRARQRKKEQEELDQEKKARIKLFEVQLAREQRAAQQEAAQEQKGVEAGRSRNAFFQEALNKTQGIQSERLPGTGVALGQVDGAAPKMGLAEVLANPEMLLKGVQAGVVSPDALMPKPQELPNDAQMAQFWQTHPDLAAAEVARRQKIAAAGASTTNVNLDSQGLTKPPQGMFRPNPNEPGLAPEPGGVTIGQESLDKQFGQDAAAWVAAGGFADAQKSITQLGEARKALEAVASGKQKGSLTGPAVSKIPEFAKPVFNPAAVKVRDAVQEVVQRNLRLVLGAQFTEKEGERLIARAYNENLDEAENAKRVGRLMKQLKDAAEAKQDAVNYFSEHGTLTGFKGKTWTLADFDPETGDDKGDRPARPGAKVIDFNDLPD
jgi:hypothetical protein